MYAFGINQKIPVDWSCVGTQLTTCMTKKIKKIREHIFIKQGKKKKLDIMILIKFEVDNAY